MPTEAGKDTLPSECAPQRQEQTPKSRWKKFRDTVDPPLHVGVSSSSPSASVFPEAEGSVESVMVRLRVCPLWPPVLGCPDLGKGPQAKDLAFPLPLQTVASLVLWTMSPSLNITGLADSEPGALPDFGFLQIWLLFLL